VVELSDLLHRLGYFCARFRFAVLGAWVLLAVGFVVCLSVFGAVTSNDLSLPGTGSQAATDLLAQEFPPQQNGASPIVFHVSSGTLTGATDQQAIQQSVAAIGKVPHVYSAADPTANPQSGLISKDGSTAFTSVLLDIGAGALTPELAQQIVAAAAPAAAAGIEVEAGGSIGATLSPAHTETSEVIGIIAAILILTFTFGSLVAMGMPIIMAILALTVSLGIVGMLGHVITIASTGPTLATMIGLGVGIDYALFLVSRHRDNLRAGVSVRESIATAVATSGSAIVFAGTTVVIALLALAVAGIPLVTSLGYATAIAVAVAVLAAITLLPAMLGIVGSRVNSAQLPRWLHPDPKPEGHGLWANLARLVTGHPWLSVLLAGLILVPLIIPIFTLRLGQEDIGVTPKSTTERLAFDQLSNGFGPGYNGPLLVGVSLAPKAAASAQYTAEYNQATTLKDSLTAQQTDLTNQANALQAQQASLLSQQTDLTNQADVLKAQQASLLSQQTDLTNQADVLKAQEASLKSQQATLAAQAAKLQQQQKELERQAALLEAQRTKLLAERDALKLVANELAQTLKDLESKQVSLIAEIVALDQQILVLPPPANLAELLLERDAKKAELTQVRSDIADTKAELRKVGQQAVSLAQQAVALKEQADALNKQAVALQQQADELAAQAAALQQQAATLQRQADELLAQAVALQQQATALQQQADELNAQAAVLQQQATALQQQADTLTQQQLVALAEQLQAEQLQAQITVEVTKAGGNAVGTDPRLVQLQNALKTPVGVQLVSPPKVSKSGTATTFTVIPTTRPADEATADLVVRVRDTAIPPAVETGVVAYVGGNTAANVDLADKITHQLPLVILTVIALSFVLLMVAFRSLLIPLQAAITNLLSAAAAFGVLTACFQWGWGLPFTGPASPYGTVPIASYVPLMMFAALFGLSMDYEVFFISQVQHFHAQGDSVRTAVRRGLAASARVIVAAAVIMICVFGSFIINADPTIKQFGVGLSVAVLLAGIMVILLAPALLVIFGERTFWVPAWLGRILPHLDLEGEIAATPAIDVQELEPTATG
jgi:uncharacterized membrane protein YdfJ with MMPL/SSD domain